MVYFSSLPIVYSNYFRLYRFIIKLIFIIVNSERVIYKTDSDKNDSVII
jgi:hypothetical protein